jgi:hypothetical protein
MTRQEFYEKYGDVEVTFSHYYKYTFTYTADLPGGGNLSCDYGGNHDEIYRFDMSATDKEKIKDLEPYAGRVYIDGDEVDSFYDY